jgi:hypothetical protein
LFRGILLASAKTFYGLETSTGIALLWLSERLFVCLKQKVVLAYLISKPATKALLVNSSGIYTLKQTQCGFAGFTIFI